MVHTIAQDVDRPLPVLRGDANLKHLGGLGVGLFLEGHLSEALRRQTEVLEALLHPTIEEARVLPPFAARNEVAESSLAVSKSELALLRDAREALQHTLNALEASQVLLD